MKELGIQEYYSFRKFGSEEKAMKAAIERRDSLLKIHKLRNQLGFRQVFRDDGFVKGLRLHVNKQRNTVVMGLYLLEEGKREKWIKERFVNEGNVDDVFFELLAELFELKSFDIEPEDKLLIKKVRMNYLREFHRLHDLHTKP